MRTLPQDGQWLLFVMSEFHPFHRAHDLFLFVCSHEQSISCPLCIFCFLLLFPTFSSCSSSLNCSSIARATSRTHVPDCSIFSLALSAPTRACRCLLVHVLCIRIPTCRALVTLRKLALSNPGPPSSLAAKTNMHKSATRVFVPGMVMVRVTQLSLEFTSDVCSSTK